MTEEAPTTESEETVDVLASELMSISIKDNGGTEIGGVFEVFVDDTGAIQSSLRKPSRSLTSSS